MHRTCTSVVDGAGDRLIQVKSLTLYIVKTDNMLPNDKAKIINPLDRKLHNPPIDFLQELVSSGLFLVSVKFILFFSQAVEF